MSCEARIQGTRLSRGNLTVLPLTRSCARCQVSTGGAGQLAESRATGTVVGVTVLLDVKSGEGEELITCRKRKERSDGG